MQFVLIRHGQTEWSASGRHTSRTDLPLLEEGIERARQVGCELADQRFALVLCSPLRRARETCELAGFGARMLLTDDLREWDYGEYEGLTTPQIRAERPDWNLWRDGCPGGERPQQVSTRADRVIDAARASDGDAIAFAHGHILRVVAARWIEMPVDAGARLALGAGAICGLGFEHGTRVIQRWNA